MNIYIYIKSTPSSHPPLSHSHSLLLSLALSPSLTRTLSFSHPLTTSVVLSSRSLARSRPIFTLALGYLKRQKCQAPTNESRSQASHESLASSRSPPPPQQCYTRASANQDPAVLWKILRQKGKKTRERLYGVYARASGFVDVDEVDVDDDMSEKTKVYFDCRNRLWSISSRQDVDDDMSEKTQVYFGISLSTSCLLEIDQRLFRQSK